MNRMLPMLLLFVLALPALPAQASQPAQECLEVIQTLPAIITKGGPYCLSRDLLIWISSGNAISIRTSNVTIDCNNFRIEGTAGAATNAIGIRAVDKLNFTLRNCAIRGFRRGVDLDGTGSAGALLVNNRFEGNTEVAIALDGSGHTVRDNLVVDSGGMAAAGPTYGIFVSGDADLIGNTIDGVLPSSGGTQPGSYGIYFDNPTTSLVQGNRVRSIDGGNSAGYGIYVNGSIFAEIVDNHLAVGHGSGNGNFGIACAAALKETVAGNRLQGYGIALLGCDDDGGNLVSP